MQRPRSHQIENISRAKLYDIIPDGWVIRNITDDYGIDVLVEIFQNEKSTGKLFCIQLKSTDKDIYGTDTELRIEVKHLEYYKSLDLPVIILYYSVKKNIYWGLWVNSEDVDRIIDKGSKTYKIIFTENQIVDKNYFLDIEKRININYPSKINITHKTDNEVGELFHKQLLKALTFYYNEYIEIDNNLLSINIHYDYQLNDKILFLKIFHNNKEHHVIKIDIEELNYLYRPVFDAKEIPKEINESIFSIANILSRYDIKTTLDIITRNLEIYDENQLDKFQILEMINNAIINNCYYEVGFLAKKAVDIKLHLLFQFINTSTLVLKRDEYFNNIYRENLLYGIANCDDISLKGILCYNLANSYRNNIELYEASKYYQLARKYEPDYINRYYWWYEYAGVLFLSNHFKLAELFYKKSYNIGKQSNFPLIHLLIGDSLFKQYKIKEAVEEYEKFSANATDHLYFEAYFKILVCIYLIELSYDKDLFNVSESNMLVEAGIKNTDINCFFEATQKYPLNSDAWFNAGVYNNEIKEYEKAFLQFLVAAVLNDDDKEAWKNCFLLSMNLRDTQSQTYILYYVLHKYGKEVINYIFEDIFKDPNIDPSKKRDILSMLEEFPKDLIV